MDENTPGIYMIKNTINNKIYIGSSACKKGVKGRWQDHKKTLRGNKHANIYLQHAWNKYGEFVFNFEMLENCKKENCIAREQYYIDTLDPDYNICRVAGNTLGQNCEDFMTADTIKIKREKQAIGISKALKGKRKTDEHAIRCGARYFNVYIAVCIQYRKRGSSTQYKKGAFVGTYLKRSDCTEELNIPSKYIRRCLQNKRQQSHGYIFEFED